MEGTVITKNGKALLAKLISAHGALRFTRVAAGAGIHQGEYDPESMEELLDYKMDGILSKCETTEDMAVLTVQIMSPNLETGFLATELGIFAKEDTDEAEEMLYAYLDMHEDPQYIYANGSSTQKIIEITLEVVIANTEQVKAEIAPDSIVFREEFEEVKESLDQTKVTEQDLRELIGEETVRAKNAETKNAEDIKTAYENSKAEIDKKIADLIGGAPETLDTLKEVADAIKENESVTDALNQSIGQKANTEDFNELNKNALLKTGDTKDNTTLFVSRDRSNPTEWTDVDTLESEEKHSSIFEKISTMVKNVRYLYKMLGSTDISAIGNGTVTGAINSLNTETSLRFTQNPEYVISNYCEIKGKNGIYKFRTYINCVNLPASYETTTIGIINSRFLTNTTISLPSKNNDIWLYVDTDGVVKIRCPQGGTYDILADVILY